MYFEKSTGPQTFGHCLDIMVEKLEMEELEIQEHLFVWK